MIAVQYAGAPRPKGRTPSHAAVDKRRQRAETFALSTTGRHMTDARLQTSIEKAFEERTKITAATKGEVREGVEAALDLLDRGRARVAEKLPGASGPNSWKVNQWLKKAVLLSFRLNDNALIDGGPGGGAWWDKVPSKFKAWGEDRFREAGFRAVPGAIVR